MPGIQPRRTAISTAVAAALAASPAVAQDQAKRKIEEVTVTATKVEESLQDVPIAVSAIGGEAIEDVGVDGVVDDRVAPSPQMCADLRGWGGGGEVGELHDVRS